MGNSQPLMIFLFLRFGLLIFAEHSRQKRIIGGEPAKANSFPWQVNFITRNTNPQECSGNLIDPHWIITAAHCFNEHDLTDFSIVAGDHYIDRKDPFEKKLDPDQVFIHPSYLPASTRNKSPGDFDVALLQLKTKIVLSPEVHPIRLPNETTTFLVGRLCTVSGWGNTVDNISYNRSNVLRQTEVKLVARDVCNSNVSYGGKIPERFLCAGYRDGGRDSCYGDSGGPLQCKISQEWILVGLVAWGQGCANPYKYGVYSDVKEILPFVNSIIDGGKSSEARRIVNDSIWRSSKIIGTFVDEMAIQVNMTGEQLLKTPLKDLFPLLLTIEKRVLIKRIASDLAINPAVLNECFLSKQVRPFLTEISVDEIKLGENLLTVLGNKRCFLKSAAVGVLEKLSNITLDNDNVLSLNLISLAMKLFNVEREELYTNLRLFSEQGGSLEKYNVSKIRRLLLQNNKPGLRNSTFREAAMNVLGIIGHNRCGKSTIQCSRNANCIDLVASHMCQCKKGFVGSGKYCRSGPGIFNVTYKESAYEFTEDLYNPTSSNYRERSDGIAIFFRYVYALSTLSDVFVGAQVQAFRKGSIVIETLQVFDFDVDGWLPSADDIKRLLHPRVELVTVQATDFCQLGADNCSYNSTCNPYPGGFYCQPNGIDYTSNSAEKCTSDRDYKTACIVLGVTTALLLFTISALFVYVRLTSKKRLHYKEISIPLQISGSSEKNVSA